MKLLPLLLSFCMSTVLAEASTSADPYIWLEDVGGERALGWVRERNAGAEKEFAADARYAPLRERLLQILDSRERIPFVTRMGEHYYNFWRDAANPRGLWRRTRLDEYRKADPAWETVLDLDMLAKTENENWVWKGADCLRPESPQQPYRHCMLSLSRGGADAAVEREFDLTDKRFVADGFALPEAKSRTDWRDADALWLATDFGPGSLTTSGYARIVKLWQRGTPLAEAATIYEQPRDEVLAMGLSERESGVRRDWVLRVISTRNVQWQRAAGGKLAPLATPHDAEVFFFKDQLLLRLRTAWKPAEHEFAAGSVIAIRLADFDSGKREFAVVYAPRPRHALQTLAVTRSVVLLGELDNVRSRWLEATFDGERWHSRALPLPPNAQVSLAATYWASDQFMMTVQDFATPSTLYLGQVGAERWSEFEPLKSLPAFFDASGLETRQYEATSRDGTRIPYFTVLRKGTLLDGSNPTLLYGYGGFEVSQLPWYSGVFGKGWLEPGGVFLLANIRGGGEFGPDWHLQARREGRQKTFDDFIAVAEDAIARGITSPRHLGVMGGSQGGLLVTGTLVQRPELFGAVVAQVPLADMLRFHKLLAGASWIGEYGDPDKPEDRAFIAKYSPYQNLRKDAKYPRIFLYTSTRDDRVHPAHARKMAARMLEQGHDVLYFENIEGGHGAAANNAQAARMWAQTFSFLWRQLAQ
jgi:prolyl oligopeptidase